MQSSAGGPSHPRNIAGKRQAPQADRQRHSLRIPTQCQLAEEDSPYVEIQWMDTIPHHLRNAENDDSPVNTNKLWFPMVSQWCKVAPSTVGPTFTKTLHDFPACARMRSHRRCIGTCKMAALCANSAQRAGSPTTSKRGFDATHPTQLAHHLSLSLSLVLCRRRPS